MSMTHEEFLNKVIGDGIEAVKKDYKNYPDKLAGALSGFEWCKDKTASELKELLEFTHIWTKRAILNDSKKYSYWYWRCFELEVEWVCNVYSAALLNQRLLGDVVELVITPTARGGFKAAEILGVEDEAKIGK